MPFVSSSGALAQAYSNCETVLSDLISNVPFQNEAGDEQSETDANLCRSELQRLVTWDAEHRAATGVLDHSLRESSHLKDRVLELLHKLGDLKVPSRNDDASSTSSSSSLDFSVGEDEPKPTVLPTRHHPRSKQSPVRSVRSETRSSEKSIGIDTTISLPESEPCSPFQHLIHQAHDLITLLFDLGPALRDPAPHDRVEDIDTAFAAEPDLQHVATKFAQADSKLLDRLGYANWERRQALIRLRNKHVDTSDLPQNYLNNSIVIKQYGVGQDRSRELYADQLTRSSSFHFSPSTVATSVTQAQTGSERGFSRKNSSLTLPTSPSVHEREDLHEGATDLLRIKPERLVVPRPPAPNHRYSGETFLCPYCFSKLEGLDSPDEWVQHVFRDLRPYMCMYPDCLRPNKTYSERQSWWNHEIEAHRLRRSWECGPCRDEGLECFYNSLVSFKQHLQERHKKLSTGKSLRLIAEMCATQIGINDPCSTCPLCKVQLWPTDNSVISEGSDEWNRRDHKISSHIADHLEQLALFVALPTGNLGSEPEIDLDFLDDSESDGDRKDEIQSIISAEIDRNMSKKDVRDRNVKRFFDNQDAFADSLAIPAKSGNDASSARPRDSGWNTPEKLAQPDGSGTINFPISTVLHPRNEFFYGKADVLEEIEAFLSTPGKIFVLQGFGGLGKTLTAVEYSYRATERYDGIFWLQADTPPGLAESYIQMTTAIGIANGADDEKRAIERGREWLGRTDRTWLIIFDNVESWESISHYLPHQFPQNRGSVLITTQKEGLVNFKNSRTKQLHTLDPVAGSSMLLNYLRKDPETDPDRELAQEISSFVGGLPVAIAHVAGYADYSRYSLDELLETFRDWRRVTGVATDEADDLPASFRQAAFSYDDTLAMVWNVTLRELSREAQDLTYILAYLNCEAVPESMIWALHEDQGLKFLDSREKVRSRRIKDSLLKRRLVEFKVINNEMCFSIHRSLQRSIRDTLSADLAKQQQIFNFAVSLVHEVFPRSSPVQQPRPEKWLEYQRLLPHLHSLRDVFKYRKPEIKGSIEFAQILSDAGINQWERGVTKEGLLLLRTAEEVLDSIHFDPHDVMRADIHTIIALMYDNTGLSNRKESIARREKAREIRKNKFETSPNPRFEDEVLLYNARMDFAISLLQFHNYAEAEPIIEDCLGKYKEWGPPEDIPYEYGKYYNKLALVRLYQRRFDEALDLARQGVYWMGKTNNFSLQSRFEFDLACILLQKGEIEQAFKLHQRIFDARAERLGHSSELTLHSRYAIGVICEMKGQYGEAEYWFTRALSLRRAAAWSEEATCRTQFHLTRVLKALGKAGTREYREMHDEAFASLQKFLDLEDTPLAGLKAVSDDEIRFDHIMTICGARFTGRGLLNYVL